MDTVDLIIIIPGMGARTNHPLRFIPGLGCWWDIPLCGNALQSAFNFYVSKDIHVRAVDYSPVRQEHGVDHMLDMVTPKKGVYYLRQMANNTAIDVLMYLNMGVADEIHNTVCHQLNTIRDEFASEHPNKHIRVSIFGHSLGSVITYDVLHKNEKSETPILNFIPENAFLIGSPLGLFLALRHAKKNQDNNLSHERKRMLENTNLFHVFHPYDTVAYRVDPHLNELFSHLDPLEIESKTKTRVQDWGEKLGNTFSSSWNMFSSKNAHEQLKEEEEPVIPTHLETVPTMLYEKKQLEQMLHEYQRVDYALKPTWDQGLNEYFVTGDVHLRYYEHKDVASFILTKLGKL